MSDIKAEPVAWSMSEALRHAIAIAMTSFAGRPNPDYKQADRLLGDILNHPPIYANLGPTPPEQEADAPEILRLLEVMFDAYENGPDCYEEPDEQAGHVGKAIKLDDEDFNRIADLLNKHCPRAMKEPT